MKTKNIIALIIIISVIILFFIAKDEVMAPTANQATEATEVESSHEEVMMEEIIDEETPTVVSTSAPETGDAKVFAVDSFSFGYSLTEIRVKQGDTVTINLTNSNGLHDWVVDEFNAATKKIKAGEKTTVTFVADKKGTFEYYCSVGSHRANGMVGKLVVE